MMRLFWSPVPVTLSASAVLLLGLGLFLSSVSAGPARGQMAGGADAMSIDMDPGGTPTNTNTSVGSIEQCARINENDTLDADEDGVDLIHIDVTVEGIPAFNDNGTPSDPLDDVGGVIGHQFEMLYPATSLTVVEHSLRFGNSLAPLTSILDGNPASSIFDVSSPVPDDDNDDSWVGSALDTSPGIPEAGSGALQRLALSTDSGAANGQHLVDLTGTYHLDVVGEGHIPRDTRTANVAIGQACGPLVTPAPTPTPCATCTPGPTRPPLGSPPVTPVESPPATPPPGDYRMEAMSIDVDPRAAPANTNASVGSLEQCARIDENDTLDSDEDAVDVIHVDVTAEGIPPYNDNGTPGEPWDDAGGILGFEFDLVYPSADLTVVGHSLEGGISFVPVSSIIAANSGSSIFDASDAVPDGEFDTHWVGVAIDTGVTDPEDGNGVLQRVALASDAGATSGQYVLNLNQNEHLEAQGYAHLPIITRIANVAIGQPCGTLVTPSPSPSPSPPPVPTPTPTPTPVPTPRPPTPTPCCTTGPVPSPCVSCTPGPTPPPGAAPLFNPGGAICFEQFDASASECDGDPAPGASSDVRTKFCLGWGPDCSVRGASRDATIDGLVFFTPPSFQLIPGPPIGSIAGHLRATLKLSLLGGACDKPVDVSYTFLNGGVDMGDVVSPKPVGSHNALEPLAADSDGNGIPDGIDKYPVFLRNAFDPDWNAGPDSVPNTNDDVPGPTPPTAPIARLGAFTKLYGQWTTLQILTFAPGVTLPFAGDWLVFNPDLGYPTIVVIEDPTTAESAGAISDTCTALRHDFVVFGRSWDNPCTNGPDTNQTRGNCPAEFDLALDTSGYPLLPCDPNGNVDDDEDGAINDGCPQTNQAPETGQQCDNNTSDDLEDSTVNDGCPQVGDVSEGGYIGGSCAGGNEGGCLMRSNPQTSGTYHSFTAAASARDADGDGWDNVIDTCVLQPNPEWDPHSPNSPDDPDRDGLPDVCDPDPDMPSPMSPLTGEDACFETGIVGPDEDGDCYGNRQDNCPLVANRGQQDGDDDAIGDACDPNLDTRDGQRVLLCMVSQLEVAVGASTTPDTATTSVDPDCFQSAVIADSPSSATPTPADAGTAESTPTPTPMENQSGTSTPTPTQVASPSPSPSSSPAPAVLGAVALPNAGGEPAAVLPTSGSGPDRETGFLGQAISWGALGSMVIGTAFTVSGVASLRMAFATTPKRRRGG